MSTLDTQRGDPGAPGSVATEDLKLEVVVIPVSDVDRAKAFYTGLGWRLDADFPISDALRIVQVTPPGSPTSIQFGTGITTAAPGSAQNTYLVVSDLEAARAQLRERGADATEVFHGNRFSKQGNISGRDPENRTYSSFVSFDDPDGNRWLLQEITTRLPGRIDSAETTFASVGDLAKAMRRAEAAHGEHEKRTGVRDEEWPTWYATYMIAEQHGRELPT
jgi:catechol 2,3-dioxygenase-like lactoylglutathione lyase family enzyme